MTKRTTMAEIINANGDQPNRLFEGEHSLSKANVYVSLTYDELDAKALMDRVKSSRAGAVVLFAGTSGNDSILLAHYADTKTQAKYLFPLSRLHARLLRR